MEEVLRIVMEALLKAYQPGGPGDIWYMISPSNILILYSFRVTQQGFTAESHGGT